MVGKFVIWFGLVWFGALAYNPYSIVQFLTYVMIPHPSTSMNQPKEKGMDICLKRQINVVFLQKSPE